MTVKKANWSEISSFIRNNCNEIIAYNFNPYDYTVSAWSNRKLGSVSPTGELLRQIKKRALSAAEEYAVPLETNAKTYTRKCELSKAVDEFMEEVKPKIEKNQKRFAMSPADLKTRWLKTIKIEREIEIFDKIQNLMMAPTIVDSLIEQGDIYGAIQHICEALSIYDNEKFCQISSLVSVKERLDKCRQFMVTHVYDNLFSELFVETVPKRMGFYKNSPQQRIRLPEVSLKKVNEYTAHLLTLKIYDDFVDILNKEIRDRLATVMSQTAGELKMKKIRQYVQTKDKFEELVDIANSYSLSHPLVCLLDKLLSKMWILLVRCNAIDEILISQHVMQKTFTDAFMSISELLRSIIQTFTSTQGGKQKVNETQLVFHFLSSDTTPTNGTASSLRTELGIKPCNANSLIIFPMVDDFFAIVEKRFNEKRQILPFRTTIDFGVISIFRAQSESISSNIDVTRPVKTEFHPFPVLVSTPILIENMEKFFAIAARFTYLQDNIIVLALNFLSEFNNRCSDEISKRKEPNVWSKKLLNERSLAQYMAQEITTQLVIDEINNDCESKIKELADAEEANEEQLMSGNVYLKDENIVRLKYHLPQVAAIAETFVVFSKHLRILSKQYTLSAQSHSKIEKMLESFKLTIIKACVFIRLEMRCRTYADIVQSLMIGNYSAKQINNQTDQYVADFAKTYKSLTDSMRVCLSPTRYTFVFIGIPRLVYDIHIRFVPRLKEVNDKGAGKLTNNLSALNQVFAGVQYPEIHIYKKAIALVSNISYTADRLLQQIALMKDLFTYEEMEPVFNMQQRMNERHAENLEKLRQILKK